MLTLKKLLFLIIAVPLVLSGCNNDKSEEDENLNYTTWERNDTLEKFGYNLMTVVHLELQKSTFSLSFNEIKKYSDESVSRNHSFNGTYTYREPRLILSYTNDSGTLEELEFTVFRKYISNTEYGNLQKQ